MVYVSESCVFFNKAPDGSLRCFANSTLWVKDWVQLKREEWLQDSCKRHQIGHLDF